MTVLVQTPSIEYIGDGVTTIFDFNFRILQFEDLKVFVDTVQQVLYSDYTLQAVTEIGGQVWFIDPPPDGLKVQLIRATSKDQQADYEPFTPFPANTTEFTIDKLTMITQELEQRFVEDTNPKVFSVFGRVGDIVADCTDYASCYASMGDWNAHIANPDAHHPQLHDLGSHTDVDLVNNSLKQGQGLWWDALHSTWENRAGAMESWPTGLASGGELNIGPGVNDIEVITGLGVLLDSYTDPVAPPTLKGLTWDQINEPITAVPSTAGSVIWFSIADTGVPSVPPDIGGIQVFVGELKQYAQGPTPSLAKQEIFLGVAVHNGDEWKEISNPKVLNQSAETLRELVTSVLPLTHIIQGGATHSQSTFEVRQDAGTVWENNRNWHVDKSDPNREALPASDPIQFKYVNRDFTDVGALTSTFDPSMYDNGTGAPVSVGGPANTTTIQRLYLDPANNYWVLWGQNTYPNFVTADANLAADGSNTIVPFILQNSILLGYCISERAKNDWDQDEAVWTPAGDSGAGGGGGGTPITSHANLNDILPDDHHPHEHGLTTADALGSPAHTDIDYTIPPEIGTSLVWTGADPAKPWELLNLYVTAGYGGIRQSAPVGLSDIGAGWVTLEANTTIISVPRGVNQDTASNALGFQTAGVWSVSLAFSLSHNESNGSRTISVRIYNITKAQAGFSTEIGVGRNTDTTTYAITSLVEIPASDVNDLFRFEVSGGADTLTTVVENSYAFSANLVSEFRG